MEKESEELGNEFKSSADKADKQTNITIPHKQKNDEAYSYEEALDLAGNGWYNIGLLASLSISILAMGIDMFGFSVVVAGSSCDFNLDTTQKSILVSMPFLGTILMSYPWGYISDTQGRQQTLFVAMTASFIFSTLGVFAPDWIVLAILKFLSTSCCSSAQSVTYALLGECCSQRVRASYLLIMTSILMLTPTCYFIIGYFILNLNISYNLGFIIFSQWRLLSLILALPLAMSALSLVFFYESPKFLVNDGQEKLAVECLRKIYERNGGDAKSFPVKRLILNEDGNCRRKDISLGRSLWEQTIPLFKPPLLWRTLQLFYLTGILYSSNNSFVIWFPFFVNTFFKGVSDSSADQAEGICNMIASSQNTTVTEDVTECISTLDIRTSLASIAHSFSFTIINLLMSKVADRRKVLMLTLMFTSSISGIGSVLVANNIASFVMFIGLLTTGLCIGPIFSYYVDLYPTSYRFGDRYNYSGMVTCLGVMVARISALWGINLVGAVIMSNCTTTFFSWSAYVFSGVVMSCFLPTDKPKKV